MSEQGRASDVTALGIDRARPVRRVDLGDGSSWVDLCEGLVVEPQELLDHALAAVPWQRSEVLRYATTRVCTRIGRCAGSTTR